MTTIRISFRRPLGSIARLILLLAATTALAPVPCATITLVLSIMQRPQRHSKNSNPRLRKSLQWNRVNRR